MLPAVGGGVKIHKSQVAMRIKLSRAAWAPHGRCGPSWGADVCLRGLWGEFAGTLTELPQNFPIPGVAFLRVYGRMSDSPVGGSSWSAH